MLRARPARVLIATLLSLLAAGAWANGCTEVEGCLAGDDGVCLPPSPCQQLAFSCHDPSLELRIAAGQSDRPPGLDALAARGDVLIGNSRMLAVIDAIESPHHLAPSGGALLDLVPRDAGEFVSNGNDELNQVLQSVGILPDDEADYHTLELLDQSPTLVAVIARGHLHGYPDSDIVTRYEVRPCEPGIRVRTEVYYGEQDPQSFLLSDGYWWGSREVTPFVPLTGQGYLLPALDLLSLGDSIFDLPLMAANGHQPGGAAYGMVRCDGPSAEGFQSDTVSAVGRERTVMLRGDGIEYERFITVAPGPGLSGATDRCREARSMLFGEASVWVHGSVVPDAGDPPMTGWQDERKVSLLFYEPAAGEDPDASTSIVPVSQVVPDADGSFSVRLAVNKSYRVRPHVLGRPLPFAAELRVDSSDTTMTPIEVPLAGVMDVQVTDARGAGVLADVILTPTSPSSAGDVGGSFHGVFHVGHCAPYLGPPHGGSPACNRVLTSKAGRASFAVPAGTYWVYASRGPFATLARSESPVVVRDGDRHSVTLISEPIAGLLPAGVLSADFHVHAGASFDSSLPEIDRAATFVSTGVQVLAATDHDVVTTYERAIAELDIGDRVVVMPGMETTGQILFLRPPGSDFPKVIGHYNFWPLKASYDLPRNGGPDDELIEPGTLFDRMEPLFDGTGVRQLNHPFAGSTFGRDEGYLTAIDYKPTMKVPSAPDETPAGQLMRRSPGGRRNIDHDVQEVMNGASMRNFLEYRAGWHSFLNQGILKGGTANSDSHTLAVEVLGYPRTLVFAGQTLGTFDRDSFNAAVRNGQMVGTNGPVLDVWIQEGDGARRPSLVPLQADPSAQLRFEVRAAPWIDVQELRVIVNGVSRSFPLMPDVQGVDPFASEAVSYELVQAGDFSLATLLAGVTGDAWIAVEAGYPLWSAVDADGDGLPDDDGFHEPPAPDESNARFHHHVVAPGTWPTAFSNPLLIDRDGDGWEAPGL